jgi:hypothetical protein
MTTDTFDCSAHIQHIGKVCPVKNAHPSSGRRLSRGEKVRVECGATNSVFSFFLYSSPLNTRILIHTNTHTLSLTQTCSFLPLSCTGPLPTAIDGGGQSNLSLDDRDGRDLTRIMSTARRFIN